MNYKHITLSLLGALATLAHASDKVTITVTNSLSAPRIEIVEADLSSIQKKLNISSSSLIVTDADGKEIPSQITYDGKLIF